MTPWQLKTWGLAQTGNRASKTRHHLQWEDTEPERDTMPSGPQKLYHSTFCCFHLRALFLNDSLVLPAPLAGQVTYWTNVVDCVCWASCVYWTNGAYWLYWVKWERWALLNVVVTGVRNKAQAPRTDCVAQLACSPRARSRSYPACAGGACGRYRFARCIGGVGKTVRLTLRGFHCFENLLCQAEFASGTVLHERPLQPYARSFCLSAGHRARADRVWQASPRKGPRGHRRGEAYISALSCLGSGRLAWCVPTCGVRLLRYCSAGVLSFRIPFGDHPLKLERYSEY